MGDSEHDFCELFFSFNSAAESHSKVVVDVAVFMIDFAICEEGCVHFWLGPLGVVEAEFRHKDIWVREGHPEVWLRLL